MVVWVTLWKVGLGSDLPGLVWSGLSPILTWPLLPLSSRLPCPPRGPARLVLRAGPQAAEQCRKLGLLLVR